MTYQVVLVETDHGFRAQVPALPGCQTEGATEEQAISNARAAIVSYTSTHLEPAQPLRVEMLSVEVDAVFRKPDRTPFKISAWGMGLPAEWTSGKIDDLLYLVEKQDREERDREC